MQCYMESYVTNESSGYVALRVSNVGYMASRMANNSISRGIHATNEICKEKNRTNINKPTFYNCVVAISLRTYKFIVKGL